MQFQTVKDFIFTELKMYVSTFKTPKSFETNIKMTSSFLTAIGYLMEKTGRSSIKTNFTPTINLIKTARGCLNVTTVIGLIENLVQEGFAIPTSLILLSRSMALHSFALKQKIYPPVFPKPATNSNPTPVLFFDNPFKWALQEHIWDRIAGAALILGIGLSAGQKIYKVYKEGNLNYTHGILGVHAIGKIVQISLARFANTSLPIMGFAIDAVGYYRTTRKI